MPTVAVVDYGMGNLFSVKQACEHAGLRAEITSDQGEVRAADAIILPGVGAFGSAMAILEERGLTSAIRDSIEAGRPFVGICLGIQLLMTESVEFGTHQGLGIIPGTVVPFSPDLDRETPVKVPQMQWNRVQRADTHSWNGTLLDGVQDNAFLYFVHSYYVVPDDDAVAIATSTYADVNFVSALQYKNVFACQFHPERSGPTGLVLYQNLARQLCSEGVARRNG
jgi:glutamine amidotransferase